MIRQFLTLICALSFLPLVYAGTPTSDAEAVLNCISTRASVRQYTSAEVSDATVDTLLRAAMCAPTAVNRQPWAFVVVRDTALRATLAKALPNAGNKLTGASVAIVVCGDSTRMLKQQPEFWVQDCSAATENLLLAAHACGLGAVWCGLYPDMERTRTTRTILGLDERYVPLCIIPVGYPAAPVNPKNKYREDAIIRR